MGNRVGRPTLSNDHKHETARRGHEAGAIRRKREYFAAVLARFKFTKKAQR